MKIVTRKGSTLEKRLPRQERLPAPLTASQLDLYTLANSIFHVESSLHEGVDVEKVVVPLYTPNRSELVDKAEVLMEFLFGRHVDFVPTENLQQRLVELTGEQESELNGGVTCLFSNGLDSYTGILDAVREFGSVWGAFTHHSDQPTLPRLMERLHLGSGGNKALRVATINGPSHGSYSRVSRGVLYVLNALLVGNSNLVISEVGPTMYQPKFTILDSISLTTHPRMLQLVKDMAETISNQTITLIKPFEPLTKAEVAAVCQNKRLARITCSCVTTRWANSNRPNCGVCYSCVLRRLAMLAAGVEDSEYRNSMTDSEMGIDNLGQLVRFSIDVINDFDGIQRYETEAIREYGKEDLFTRFALDNIVGLMEIAHSGNDWIVQKLLALGRKVVSNEELDDRRAALAEAEAHPDYGNRI